MLEERRRRALLYLSNPYPLPAHWHSPPLIGAGGECTSVMEREAEAVWGGSGVAFQLRFGDGPGNVQTLAGMLRRHEWGGSASG